MITEVKTGGNSKASEKAVGIDVGSTNEKKAGDMIKGRMEKWLRRIWK